MGRTDKLLCPVVAVSAYLAVWGYVPGPFFLLACGTPLSREVLVRKVRAALWSSVIDMAGYPGHFSFWIGAGTTAAAVGLEDSPIRTLRRWQSSAYVKLAVVSGCSEVTDCIGWWLVSLIRVTVTVCSQVTVVCFPI